MSEDLIYLGLNESGNKGWTEINWKQITQISAVTPEWYIVLYCYILLWKYF